MVTIPLSSYLSLYLILMTTMINMIKMMHIPFVVDSLSHHSNCYCYCYRTTTMMIVMMTMVMMAILPY